MLSAVLVWAASAEAPLGRRVFATPPRRVAYRALSAASSAVDEGAVSDVSDAFSRLTTHCEALTAEDRQSIEERQLKHRISAMAAGGKRCKYGFPQAIALDPLARQKYDLGGHPVDAALFRLTCPHLVKAIDEWEAEGAVRTFNLRLAENEEWARSADVVNADHREIRRALVGDETRAAFDADPVLSVILNSGLAGITKPGDIKCLHAQLADELCRGENAVAQGIREGLQERGVDPSGGCSCWQQCDLKHTPTPESWTYQPVKNRQKLRATADRRRSMKSFTPGKRNQPRRGPEAEAEAPEAEADGLARV